MINFKKGFTLAELLISLGILSIIATIGFTLTKQSIERAYDMYIYTGYKGIHNAILDANAHGLYINNLIANNNNRTFFEHITNVLDGNLSLSNNIAHITTPSGISYDFDSIRNPNNPQQIFYSITMTLPKKRTRDGDEISTCLGFRNQDTFGVLLPLPSTFCSSSRNTTIDLRRRIDLLPFYIDTGFTGRTRPNEGFVPREYYSAEDAICSITRENIVFMNTFGTRLIVYHCSTRNLTQIVGAVKPAHPRKIR